MIELDILAADSSGNTFLISSILHSIQVSTDYYQVQDKFLKRTDRLAQTFQLFCGSGS